MYAVVELTDIEFQTVTLDVQNQARQVERAISHALGRCRRLRQCRRLPAAIVERAPGPAGSFPSSLTSVSFASVLEEYKFFIREDFTIPGDATSLPTPKLARARMLPNTDILHPDGAIDIADNVFDLQVALGVDLDGNGRIDVEDAGGVALATNADEWLWNGPGEDDTLAVGHRFAAARAAHHRGPGPDRRPDSTSRRLSTDIENHDYNEPAAPTTGGEVAARRYRRRVLQSTIDLRNL